ncbi:MAG TPA: hypothetical protein VJG64_02075 [Candidatus Paceibacterota bacterium]
MQAVVGTIVLIILCLGAVFLNLRWKGVMAKIWRLPGDFGIAIVAGYGCLAILGGTLWGISWIGIKLHEILPWLVGAVLYPWHWIF